MNELYVDSIGSQRYIILCDAGGCDARNSHWKRRIGPAALANCHRDISLNLPAQRERGRDKLSIFICAGNKNRSSLEFISTNARIRRARLRFAAGAFNRASLHKLITLRVQISNVRHELYALAEFGPCAMQQFTKLNLRGDRHCNIIIVWLLEQAAIDSGEYQTITQ